MLPSDSTCELQIQNSPGLVCLCKSGLAPTSRPCRSVRLHIRVPGPFRQESLHVRQIGQVLHHDCCSCVSDTLFITQIRLLLALKAWPTLHIAVWETQGCYRLLCMFCVCLEGCSWAQMCTADVHIGYLVKRLQSHFRVCCCCKRIRIQDHCLCCALLLWSNRQQTL